MCQPSPVSTGPALRVRGSGRRGLCRQHGSRSPARAAAPVMGTPMIDSALALPLYHQVAGILRQRIEEGVYPAGVRLNSEDELAVEFDVSRATVRQAMGELATEGLVVRRRGRGTFVEDAGRPVLTQRFRGSLSALLAESPRTTTRD